MWQYNMSPDTQNKVDLLQGTLDVMVLRTLSTMGPLHGFGVARRIKQTSDNQVLLNKGTVYASLVRLQQHGWVDLRQAGNPENNRKAKYYSIKKQGSKQLATDTAQWLWLADVMAGVLNPAGEDSK